MAELRVTVEAGRMSSRATIYTEVSVGRGYLPTTWSGVAVDLPDRIIESALADGRAVIAFPGDDEWDDDVRLGVRAVRREGSDLHFEGLGLPPPAIW